MNSHHFLRRGALAALAALGLAAAPLAAQVETIDPDTEASAPIDGDLAEQPGDQSVYGSDVDPGVTYTPTPATDVSPDSYPTGPDWQQTTPADGAAEATTSASTTATATAPADGAQTYHEDDLIGAAEGVFGSGAKGVASMIQKLLAEQGEPNAYIVGREASGAFVVGARYGSGTLFHKVEGERPVYWTGPSIGFDAGANAGSTFVLVYNLYDSEELYKRFPAGEGQAYFVGGLTASYMRKGDVVLIPIRVGAGLRLGINAGYMKFSKKQKWLPF